MDSHDFLQTLVTAVAAGVALQWLAARLRIPAIAPLLVGGILLGPGLIDWVRPDSLGTLLEPLIGLILAVILFEGGLSLDRVALKQAPRAIWRLVTLGAILTWMLTAWAAWFLLDLPVPVALLLGSLVIVTGPTVVNPLLRRIGLHQRLHNVLHWEAVIIDPIGVFVAVLCLEALMPSASPGALSPWMAFLLRLGAGLVIGLGGGLAIDWLLRNHRVRRDQNNLVVFAGVLLMFGVSDSILPHTGILTVTLAGFVLGLRHPPEVRHIQEFMLQLTDLGIGVVFMLLAAGLDLHGFALLGWRGALLLMWVILVVRPLIVGVCTLGSSMTRAERLFASWVAPRGIVAASMASLVAIQLSDPGAGDAESAGGAIIEPFVFAVIGLTVLLQGSTAGLVARLLGVRLPELTGWLVIGGGELGRATALALRGCGVEVCLIDRNITAVNAARKEGLAALQRDAFDFELPEEPIFAGVGHVLSVTANAGLNRQLAARWAEELEPEHVHTWTDLASSPAQRGSPATPEREGGAVDGTAAPSPLAMERAIARGEFEILALPAGVLPAKPGPNDPKFLLVVRDGVATPHRGGTLKEGDQVIVLRRRVAVGPQLFRAAMRLLPAPDTMVTAQERLLDLLLEREPQLDRSAILGMLKERDRTVAMVGGESIAIAHAVSSKITDPMCVVGTLPAGLAQPGQGEAALKAVFLLISPPGKPQAHLAALAQIARVAEMPHHLEGLADAPDEATILVLVVSASVEPPP